MTVKHLCLLLLAVVAFCAVEAQNGDELPIPVENDNQFPPDNQAEPDFGLLEGANGAIQGTDEPKSSPSEILQPVPLEEIEPTDQLLTEVGTSTDDTTSCPDKCLCNFEADDFVIDCSGQQLTEFPLALDPRTTKLKIQNNKLTEIPKEISSFTKLKYLNASNNSIMDLTSGSISELPELVVLDLSNNRLIEYPKDLKNSFELTKLEEINLGGNDIRVPLDSDTLAKFTSLEKLIVPSGAFEDQLEVSLCQSLKESLKTICVESCYDKELSCTNVSENVDMENEQFYVIPGALIDDIGKEGDDPTMDLMNDNDATDLKPKENDMLQGNGELNEGESVLVESQSGAMINDNIGKEDDKDPTMDSMNDNVGANLTSEDNDMLQENSETTESGLEKNYETTESDLETKEGETDAILSGNTSEVDNEDPTPDLEVNIDVKSKDKDIPQENVETTGDNSEIKASDTEIISDNNGADNDGDITIGLVNSNDAIDLTSKIDTPHENTKSIGSSEIKTSEIDTMTSDNIDKDDGDQTIASMNNDGVTDLKLGDNNEAPENSETAEGNPTIKTNDTPNVDTNSASEFSLRSAVIQEPEVPGENAESGSTGNIEDPIEVSKFNTLVENPKEESTNVSESPKTEEPVAISKLNSIVDIPKQELEPTKLDESATDSDTDESYKVGAKTSDTKTGGVDKSVIGIIVAAMVLVVAGVTIKKNWSSIRRKFSSNSRTPNDRSASNANGTTPEEVPLQDKSPV